MKTIYDFLKEIGISVSYNNLIEEALTHSSYVNEHKESINSNERLEFMGDAVLQIYTSNKIYNLKPPLSEGKMTTLRSYLVNEKALSGYVKKYELNRYLKLGAGEEKMGGRERSSVIADMFESLVGAIYLEYGYDKVSLFLDKIMGDQIKEREGVIDYKTQLQEFVQADRRSDIEYVLINNYGPSNAPTFEIAVKVDGIILGKGIASSKKEAQKLAAKDALLKLVK